MDDKTNEHSLLPQDRAELMQRIQDGWTALEGVIGALGDEQMWMVDAGGWSIKDNLAHLAVWDSGGAKVTGKRVSHRMCIQWQFPFTSASVDLRPFQCLLESL